MTHGEVALDLKVSMAESIPIIPIKLKVFKERHNAVEASLPLQEKRLKKTLP